AEIFRITGGLNPAIAAGLAALVVRRRALPAAAWLAGWCAVMVAGWAFGLGGVGRYLVPAIAPATALAIALWTGRGDWPRRIAMVSVAAGAVALIGRPEFSRPSPGPPRGTYGVAVGRAAAEAGRRG